ncbi:MAG TPA: symmetrical bis(5'-nucleosyl)-tetraphosphatase [Thermoanaerobaculia bacterium]|nr:symmetrical bis(5'-nucleosyl)-tetraphosphatase [Thermoanaerobaculia bacterium]
MATWAIGDVHGCVATLRRLLERVGFDRRRDRLWAVGDLVNRGPRSLEALRWAAAMGDRLVAVLGNHDLHLLARARGIAEPRRRDTLDEVLAAPDRDDLLDWLIERPLLHREGEWTLVHAGLFPAWTLAQAERLARDTEAALRGREGDALLRAIDRKTAERWEEGLAGRDRARAALAAFARLRTLTADGRMCPDFTGPPAEAPDGCAPWFERPRRSAGRGTVVFGHWAALGLHREDGVVCLDSGAAWGRSLSALRLDDGRLVQQRVVD